jgi:membrane protein implicated in regulation of membrane protease activity
MESWWDALSLERQIFYGIGILSLFSLGIQLVLVILGGSHDHDFSGGGTDLHMDGHSSGLGVFSIRGISSFFLGFGWGGIIALKAGLGLFPAITIGILLGALLMFAIFLLFRTMLRLQTSGTLDYSNAIGQVGTAYTTIPASQKTGGQVEVMIQGRLCMAEALNKGAIDVKPGTKVKIVEKISHATLIVEPLA